MRQKHRFDFLAGDITREWPPSLELDYSYNRLVSSILRAMHNINWSVCPHTLPCSICKRLVNKAGQESSASPYEETDTD